MGLFDRLFNRKADQERSITETEQVVSNVSDNYRDVPKWLDYDETNADNLDKTTLGIIASSVAATTSPGASYKVASIKERNPDYLTLSLITAAIAKFDGDGKQYRITSIKEII
jgi:hypothetical protein